MRLLTLALLVAARFSAAAVVEDAKCVQTGPTTYRIEFRAPAGQMPVAIYASSRADRIDRAEPVLAARSSPVDVTVAGATGRVYFHLKPKSGGVRVVSIRRLPLEGAPNFRDLGGYRTADGRYTKWGMIYRAGALSKLTAKDYDYLAPLGIKLVCDLRIDRERGNAPTNWAGANPPRIVPATIDTITWVPEGMEPKARMLTVYNRLPFDASAPLADMVHRILKGETPTMFHCSAGKDRTGTFAAFLLTALGVPFATIREDFLLTNRYLVPEEREAELAAETQKRLKLEKTPDLETLRYLLGVDADYLDVAFKVINEKFGSFDGYWREQLKLTPADLTALRQKLLED
jgi:protein-tyrosine phosphatase